LFSHGQGGIRQQSTFYTVVLASHGYVVVAPDHQGDTIVEVLERGDVEIDTAARSFVERPLDLVFLMNAVDALGDDPLREIVDMQRIATTGHSFGAFTAMATAGQNVGVAATVAQAPVGVGAVETSTDYPLEEFGIPIMIQSSGEDRILPAEQHAQSLWDHMVSPRAWMNLVRGGHFTYSDLCVFDVEAIDAALDIDASNVLDDGCGPENISPPVAFKLINNSAIGFFNIHLRGSSGSSKYLVPDADGESTIEAD
jgi:dienelactone hydrolase